METLAENSPSHTALKLDRLQPIECTRSGLEPDFQAFLHLHSTEMARVLTAWTSQPEICPFENRDRLEELVDRSHLVDLVVSSAPWDDHYIRFARNPALLRKRTAWFVGLGFGGPEETHACTVSFLHFCKRHGLKWPSRAQDTERHRSEIGMALHYAYQWRRAIARKLIGSAIDCWAASGDFDDGVPF